MKRAGADLHVVGLEDHAAIVRPEALQRQDQALKRSLGAHVVGQVRHESARRFEDARYLAVAARGGQAAGRIRSDRTGQETRASPKLHPFLGFLDRLQILRQRINLRCAGRDIPYCFSLSSANFSASRCTSAASVPLSMAILASSSFLSMQRFVLQRGSSQPSSWKSQCGILADSDSLPSIFSVCQSFRSTGR